MGMKETLLQALRQGGRISGEELGRALRISRTAVWKHIAALRREGYRIDSSPGKGYLLVSAPDSLLPEEIKAGLMTSLLGQRIAYHSEVASTQDVAKALAAQGADEGTIVVAETQVAGRGRIGRGWASPPGGIYLSIILRPDIKPFEAIRFPLIAGVAIAQAIERLTGLKPQLKWPNDIIVGGRKTGGILTEMSAETDRINYIILGIGVNVNTAKAHFPEEIEGIATSLRTECGKEVPRVQLVQGILAELESLYQVFQVSGFETIRERWKAQSCTIGTWVSVRGEREQVEGEALDIDEDGALILRKANGALERVVAGDVIGGAVVSSQQSAVGSQESGGRSQKSGARSQEARVTMRLYFSVLSFEATPSPLNSELETLNHISRGIENGEFKG
jgi:BirA family biotin operon repressor/biotin-[acetyl-CoA-carboxylase] ligase